MFGRKKKEGNQVGDDHIRDANGSGSERTLTGDFEPSKAQIKRATRTRLCWDLACSLLLLISVVFLILVEIGDTKATKIRLNIHFIKLNLTNIIPLSVPDATLINSIAETIGLHDFYTVGLWGFCQGDTGATWDCSTPKALYWFDPVSIISSELIAGASIALPAEVDTILSLIRIVSHWMFGLFLTGACLSFIMIFLVPLSVYTRWATFPIMLLTFLAALMTTVATVIATVMFIIMQKAVTDVSELNIGASLGVEMFAFMWIASGTAILAWLIQLGQCCCCASRRDVRRGKKTGSKKAWRDSQPPVSEKPVKEKRGLFGRKK